jgi:iron complex transport system ATP-binding protein
LLAQDPIYFFLDEPNSHLDLHYQISILDYLRNNAREKQRALVMTLHDINLASRFCDYVILLNGDGEVHQGAASELLTPVQLTQTFKHEIVAINSAHGTYFQPR